MKMDSPIQKQMMLLSLLLKKRITSNKIPNNSLSGCSAFAIHSFMM